MYKPPPLMLKALHCVRATALLVIANVMIAGLALANTLLLPNVAAVVDQAGVLSADEHQQLSARIAAFRAERGTEFGILLIRTLGNENLEAHANAVANHWRLGRQGIGDGIVIIVVVDDRQARIEVSKSLEGAVPDAMAKRILAEAMRPYFARRDFHGGLHAGLNALFRQVSAEGLPTPADAVDNAARDQHIGEAISASAGAIMLLVPGYLFFRFAGRWSRHLALPFSLFLAFLMGRIAFTLCNAVGYTSASMIAGGVVFIASALASTIGMFQLALATPVSLAAYAALRREKAQRKSLAARKRTRRYEPDDDQHRSHWDDDNSRSSSSTSSSASSDTTSSASSGGGNYGGGASDRW